VAAGLQQPIELDVLDEARPRAALVDDECRGREVCAWLVARERLSQLVRETHHRAPVSLLPLVRRDVHLQQPHKHGPSRHSY